MSCLQPIINLKIYPSTVHAITKRLITTNYFLNYPLISGIQNNGFFFLILILKYVNCFGIHFLFVPMNSKQSLQQYLAEERHE